MLSSKLYNLENLLNFSLNDLLEEFKPAFRAKQIYSWIHKELVFDFDRMTNLSKELRAELKTKYELSLPKIKDIEESNDGTKKYLFELHDRNLIESVLLEDENGRKTICLSTQVGCPMECGFCATAKLGFKRNLETSEILGQVYLIKGADNLVFMGMGEPFRNYDNVIKSIKILISEEGQNFGQRRITVSTCGLIDGIQKFAEENFQVRLAVSLNSADDEIRSQLMPINTRYPLKYLIDAIRTYNEKTGRRATLEYIMLCEINDSDEAAKKLIALSKNLDVHINLIPFNDHSCRFRPSTKERIKAFFGILEKAGLNVVIRRSRGDDINAACGQLVGSFGHQNRRDRFK